MYVSAGRAQVAQRPHYAAVVSAAAHGYFIVGVTVFVAAAQAAPLPIAAMLLLLLLMVRMMMMPG